jgi:hypothetical protein
MRIQRQNLWLWLAAAGLAAIAHAFAQGTAPPTDPARWQLWLNVTTSASADPPTLALPSARLAAPDAAWLERWGRLPPAIAWNDTVIDLIVKYQQNPLRATRAMALMHAAMHDALVLCARAACGEAAIRIALHAAASRTLRHLYPQESPGRFDALAWSAAYATITAHAPDGNADGAWGTQPHTPPSRAPSTTAPTSRAI